MKRFLNNEDGAVLVNFSLAISVIILATGAALDMSASHKEYAKLQYATDIATLAALAASQEREDEAAINLANQIFALNHSSNNLDNIRVNFTIENDEILGISRGNVPLAFGRFLGRDNNPISVSSRVSFNKPEGEPCILTLSIAEPISIRQIAKRIHIPRQIQPRRLNQGFSLTHSVSVLRALTLSIIEDVTRG